MALNFNYLNRQVQELEEYFPFIKFSSPAVSKVDVGWHIAHSFRVINIICESLKNSNPEDFQPGFNFKRMVVFTLGGFPRGKTRAPKVVRPEGEITLENLLLQMSQAKTNLSEFDLLEKNHHFHHPYFNQLNKIQAKRLLEVHTRHHLKIIRDIIRAN